MPVFVGSSGDETELRSDRVGFAVSTANPSSASAGDSYFNSTDKQLKVYNGSDWDSVGAGGGISDGLIASGTLSDGSTVVINTDGTVSVVTGSSTPEGVGTESTLANVSNGNYSSAYDSTNNKLIIAYRDTDGYGKAKVGTVSGTSISFGSPATFNSSSTEEIAVAYDTVNNHAIIVYRNNGNGGYGTAIAAVISGTSITFGSTHTFTSHEVSNEGISAVWDPDSEKVIVAWRQNNSPYYGKAVIIYTVSGTSISSGNIATFESGLVKYISAVYDTTNNKVVIAYQDYDDNRYGKAVVGTVNGLSLSFGSPVLFSSNGEVSYLPQYLAYVGSGKVVIAYKDEGDSNKAKAKVGTVSGTSISFGLDTVFDTDGTIYTSMATSSDNKVLIAYQDEGNSYYGTLIIGTVSGTTITFDSPFIFNSDVSQYTFLQHDPDNNKVVIFYRDSGNSYQTSSSVFSFASSSTNLTSTNFLGFSDGAYTNGQTAKIQIAGSVDDAQSSLTPGTQYYVQNDGSLSSSAGSPSVLAGTAISSTKIIVRK